MTLEYCYDMMENWCDPIKRREMGIFDIAMLEYTVYDMIQACANDNDYLDRNIYPSLDSSKWLANNEDDYANDNGGVL